MASRHRSNTSMSARSTQRPDSRASTTSATSQHQDAHPDFKSAQSTYIAGGPEAALLQYQAGMQNGYHIDPSAQQQQFHPAQPQQYPLELLQGTYSAHDSPYMQPGMTYNEPVRLGSVPASIAGAETEDKRRKGSAVTATNDKELREMLSRNEGRPLKEVAQEVIQKERTPMAEKTKQLFAMLWLRAVCKPAKTSVPRNRVYSHYATRCGTERVVPLNPASFGKLVRVIFPGIQTRRLGVRGESKYHYVDLALEEEQPNQVRSAWHGFDAYHMQRPGPRRSESAGAHLDFNSIPRLPADTASFPTHDASFDMMQHARPPTPRGPPSQGKTFAYPDTRGMQHDTEYSTMYDHRLRFPPQDEPPFQENDAIALPDIMPYCPPRTDNDTAEALTALYRTHCTSLVDCVRFCKERQFFRLFTSFHGTLTVPVQKLLAHPNLAPWIQECDWLMYQKMVRFVSRLTLQAAPVVVINILNNISSNLHAHIQKTFQSQPAHVLQAKLKPATIFAGLLYRLIRVNAAAHAAANLLTIDQNREQMWREWVMMVNPKRIMEAELPDCGYEEVYKIITSDIRSLLEPLMAPPLPDHDFTPFDAQMFAHGQPNNFRPIYQTFQNQQQDGQISTENVLDRWSAFLSSLPARFPHASTRTLLHCVSAIGTAALRDITIAGGASYQYWWVMKIFVDEMALWLAEMGGFLDHKPTDAVPQQMQYYESPVLENGDRANGARSHSGSRMSSMGADAAMNGGSFSGMSGGLHEVKMPSNNYQPSFDVSGQQPYQHPLQQWPPSHTPQMLPQQHQQHPPHDHTQFVQVSQQHHEPDIDDSGIGMTLMDELRDDLAASKYGSAGSHIGIENTTGDVRVNTL